MDSAREERLAEVLGSWQEAREEGKAAPPADVISAHPDLADELRAQFAFLGLLDRALEPPAPSPAGAPPEIGDFRIVRELGRGGMGVVYEAEQISMRRPVALKVLSLAITGTPQAVRRFQREARAAGRLHHTNIVPVHAMGQHAGYWYYAMELVRGPALGRVIAEMRGRGHPPTEESLARQSVAGAEPIFEHAAPSVETSELLGTRTGERAYFVRIAEMFAGVAEALDLAHAEGVIHRDIKPSNLLLDTDGTLKIVDFGLARLEGEGPGMTITGDLLGTPTYMSPEQAMAKRIVVDHRTDIYSLGATLYETLTLRPPFKGETLQDLCSQIITKDPILPRRRNHHVPKDLETVVLKAMEKDRDKRYRSAGELARDLRRFAEGGAIQARRIGPTGRAWRKVKRHKVRSSLVVAILLLLTGGSILAIRFARESARRLSMQYAQLCAEGRTAYPRWSEDAAEVQSSESAHAIYSRAIELAPDRPEAYWLRAFVPGRTIQERLADVEAAFERGGLTRRSYHLTRATVLAQCGRFERSEEDRRLAATSAPATLRDRCLQGLLLEAEGRHREAMELLCDVLACPDLPEDARYQALASRARLHVWNKAWEEALEDLHALQAMGDDSRRLSVRIVGLWHVLGREARAQALLDELVRDLGRRQRASVWTEYASFLRVQLERYDEALAASDQAIEIDPSHAKAHYVRGSTLIRLKRYDESLISLDRAVELDPTFAGAHCNRAYALHQIERYEEALAAQDRALELDPRLQLSHWMRGHALKWLGRDAEALAAYEAALELDDAHWGLRVHTAALLLSSKDPSVRNPERALALARTAVQLDPNPPRSPTPPSAGCWRILGSAYYANGMYRECLDALSVSIGLPDGERARTCFRAAMACGQLGRKDEGHEWYARALELMEQQKLDGTVSDRLFEVLEDQRAEAEQVLGIEPE